MAIAAGVTSILGIKNNSSWTNAGQDASDKVPFLSESINWGPESVESEALHGKTGKLGGQITHLPIEGSIDTELWYDIKNTAGDAWFGTDMLLGMVCGDNGVYATSAGYYLPQDDFLSSNPYITIACLMGDLVKEVPSALISGCSITGSAGGNVTASFDIIGNKMSIGDTRPATDSEFTAVGGFLPANTAVELQALFNSADYEDSHYNAVIFRDTTFLLGDTANALTAGDEIGISDFTISINNNLSGSEQVSPEASGHTNSYWNYLPQRNGFREVTLDFTVPRHNVDTFHAYRDNQTELQAHVKFTRNATNTIDFRFPSIRIQTVDAPIGGSGLTTVSCSAKAYIPAHSITKFGANTGVTVNREFGIETLNTRTATPW